MNSSTCSSTSASPVQQRLTFDHTDDIAGRVAKLKSCFSPNGLNNGLNNVNLNNVVQQQTQSSLNITTNSPSTIERRKSWSPDDSYVNANIDLEA